MQVFLRPHHGATVGGRERERGYRQQGRLPSARQVVFPIQQVQAGQDSRERQKRPSEKAILLWCKTVVARAFRVWGLPCCCVVICVGIALGFGGFRGGVQTNLWFIVFFFFLLLRERECSSIGGFWGASGTVTVRGE